MLVWPNLSRARTVSIRLLLLWDEVQSLMSFLISLSFLPSLAKEFHFRCHPLVIASISGLLISVWGGIAFWGAVGALNAAASVFSFPQTLTYPGTQHRSMIILSSSSLRISSLVSTKIGEKEESDLRKVFKFLSFTFDFFFITGQSPAETYELGKSGCQFKARIK